MDAWGVDVVVAGSQKGLMLPPGLAFCALSEKAWAATKTATLPRYYFDLPKERAANAKNDVRFTPAVSIVVGLREVFRMLERKAIRTCRRHDRLAQRDARGRGGARPVDVRKRRRAPRLTAVVAPRGIDGEKIVAAYSQTHNITIAGGQGEMKGKLFRLGHMGYAAEFDVIVALAALEQVLAELGVPVDVGAGIRGAQKVFAGRG